MCKTVRRAFASPRTRRFSIRNGSGRAPSFTPDEYEVDLFEHVGDSTPVAHISVKRGDWPRVLSELTSAEAGSTVLYYPRTQVFLGVEED